MTDSEPVRLRAAHEEAIRTAWQAQDFEEATTLALRYFGPEILGYMLAQMGSGLGSDAFQDFSLKAWRSWSTFNGHCSTRSWLYRIARSVVIDTKRKAKNRPERNIPLSEARISKLAEQVRSATLIELRSSTKTRARLLQEKLTLEERELLTLRVDRRMAAREIAIVLRLCDEGADMAELDRAAARVRKRFELTRKRLADLVRRESE